MRYTRPCDMPPELEEFLEGYIATYLLRNCPVGVWFDVDDLEEQRIWAEKQLNMLLFTQWRGGLRSGRPRRTGLRLNLPPLWVRQQIRFRSVADMDDFFDCGMG